MFSLKKMKCTSCKKKHSISINCKYCSTLFCISCIQQEVHGCNMMSDMISELSSNLNKRILSERCVKKKIEKI